jgi:hypothetical protein
MGGLIRVIPRTEMYAQYSNRAGSLWNRRWGSSDDVLPNVLSAYIVNYVDATNW